MMWRACQTLLACGVCWIGAASAHAAVVPSAPSNSFGNVGLLQTPTARFNGAGTFRIGFQSARPIETVTLSAQPYDWLETSYRYTRFNYGGIDGEFVADGQLDKSFDVKLGLLAESRFFPSLAVGIQDVGGTGLLASEYVVASKQLLDFEFSLGIGWGRLGSRGDFGNPLVELDQSFERRDQAISGQGGEFEFDQFFRGQRVAVFGGVRWSPNASPWSIMLERDGNDYGTEPFGNDLTETWPVNLGLAYQRSAFGVRAGFERGEQVSLGLYVSYDISKPGPEKALDPPPTPVAPPSVDGLYQPGQPGDNLQRDRDLQSALARQDITLIRLRRDVDGQRLTAWVSDSTYRDTRNAIDRTARTLSMLAADGVERLRVVTVRNGLEQSRVTLSRHTVRLAASGQAPASTGILNAEYADGLPTPVRDDPALAESLLDVDWFTGPRYVQSLGDPDEAYRAQLFWRFGLGKQWSPYLSSAAIAEVGVLGNLDDIERESDSVLPRVRSDVAEYYSQGEHGLRRLETNYIRPLGKDWFGRVSAGIFEEMFGGVAAEVLFRPFGRNWAVGANINRVRQRAFDQRFDFRNYEVTTGHLTVYSTFQPLSIDSQVSVGCYLAGDCGATVKIARTFETGATMGFFATKTNVSSEEFGEGSFDKGFFVTLPFDLFLPRSTTYTAALSFRPLTRDGGQKVRDGRSLYQATDTREVLRYPR